MSEIRVDASFFRRNGGLLVAAFCLSISFGLCAPSVVAAPLWAVVAPDETFRTDESIQLDVFRPTAQDVWPETLRFRMEQGNKAWEVALSAVGSVMPDDMRRTYRGVMPAHVSGLVRGELLGVESNRLALLIREPDAIEKMLSPDDGAEVSAVHAGRALSMVMPDDEAALSVNDPMYFVVGKGGVARFQFSFKYRMFDPDSRLVEWFSPLANFHLGYTQTSIWDLGANSRPFRDSSYRPSFFWQGTSLGEGLKPDLVRAGFEHESNGKDGLNSRSINTLFLQPGWITRSSDGHFFGFWPKMYVYQDKEDNPDIQRYRGYTDWQLGYGRMDGMALTALFRSGTAGYGSAQIEVSYPLRNPLFARTGGFIFLQLFKGYGETLLDYNRNSSTQARLGFAIVR
jgi:phospholipase A1/A2